MRSISILFLIYCMTIAQAGAFRINKAAKLNDNENLPSAEQKLIESIKKGIDSEKNFEALQKLNDKQESEITAKPIIVAINLEAQQKIDEKEKAHIAQINNIASEYDDLVKERKDKHNDNLKKLKEEKALAQKQVDLQAKAKTKEEHKKILQERSEKLKAAHDEHIEEVLNRQIEHSEILSEHFQDTQEMLDELKEERDRKIEETIEEYQKKKDLLISHNEAEEKLGLAFMNKHKIETNQLAVQNKLAINAEVSAETDSVTQSSQAKQCLEKIEQLEDKIDKLEEAVVKTFNLNSEVKKPETQ